LFAVGHLALGHILGYTTSKTLKTNINLPLILVLSIIPDIDLLIPQIQHRGPTHSIITATVIFIPLFIIYKQKTTPYFTALIQHSLIGDFISGGKVQLLWPITTQHYGMQIGIRSPANIPAELILFTTSIIILLKTKQATTLFKADPSNLLLLIPLPTALLPTLFNYPLEVPIPLIPPHLIYILIFSTSITITIIKTTQKHIHNPQKNKTLQTFTNSSSTLHF
jgi:membrane-bound metal-dependent hydrolase YbcI (DUF457 family)